MKILVYCQHVLGIGHLARTMNILAALEGHEVVLVLGGPETAISVPAHVRVVQLPPLRMDARFSGLQAVAGDRSLETIRTERRTRLLDLFARFRPRVLLVELFPFGRNAFRFELEPLLDAAGRRHDCRVACSVRDILVERDNREKFERRVIERLNHWFDLLLIHSDPDLVPLDLTFSRMDEIRIPVHYTGFICRRPGPEAGARIRHRLSLVPGERLVVASAGGGSVGHRLLAAVLAAHRRLAAPPCRLRIFTGPYLDAPLFARLVREAGPGARVRRFTDRFPDWLAAADLSISMGGYNTTLDTVAAGCPALIHPFAQNREQRLRAELLQPCAPLTLLGDDDLEPEPLATLVHARLTDHHRAADGPGRRCTIRLDGGPVSARILTGDEAWQDR